jgi:hypothetical protein
MRTDHPRWGAAIAALLMLSAATAGAADASGNRAGPRVESLVPLSASGFSNCPFELPPPFSLTGGDAQPDDTAVEPRVAVDPQDSRRMAAAWMQDMFGSVVVASTDDGGRTWERSVPPNVSGCSGSEGAAFDPSLAFGPDGTLYLSLMRHLRVQPGRTTPENEIAVLRSQDGGRSWGQPVVVAPRSPAHYNDYPTLAVSPDQPGQVFVAWERVSEPLGGNSLGSFVSASTDGGQTFSPPVPAYRPTQPFSRGFGVLTAAERELSLVLTVSDSKNALPLLPDAASRLVEVRSADAGRTWSAPVTVREYTKESNPSDPDSGDVVQAGTLSVARGPAGVIVATWLSGDVNGPPTRLELARRSPDGAWSAVTPPHVPSTAQVVLPAVAMNQAGETGLVWYDTRRDVAGDEEFTADAWFSVLPWAEATWRTAHVAGAFDLRGAYDDVRDIPPGSIRFLGDYVGLAGTRSGFVAALPLSRPIAQVGASQVFAAQIQTGKRRG